MPAFLHTEFQDRVDPRFAVDVPQPAPDVIPEPPDEKPDRVPPEINPPETPPEVNEPTVPGEHVPVHDPIVPGEGLSAGAAAALSPSHLESTHQQRRLRGPRQFASRHANLAASMSRPAHEDRGVGSSQ